MRRSSTLRLRLMLAAGVLAGSVAGLAFGQSYLRSVATAAQGNDPPDAEFHMARLVYQTSGCAGSRGIC